MIVKIQKPLMSNDPSVLKMFLFYNIDRSYKEQRFPTKEEIKAMGNNFKIFAEYTDDTHSFVKKVEWQDW